MSANNWINRCHFGDCVETMRRMPAGIVQTCVTSPPYFNLRDYGHAGQIGMESTPAEFVGKLVEVFREVRRVLRDDGTLWLNLGDSYSTRANGPTAANGNALHGDRAHKYCEQHASRSSGLPGGLKHKDLIGIPWRVAFALQEDGWYLRQDIIWSKPNPMPESVTDRCTKAHEYLFLLSKSERYHFDSEGIAEPLGSSSIARLSQNVEEQEGSDRVPGKTNGNMKAVGRRAAGNKTHKGTTAYEEGEKRFRTKAGLVSFAERERAKVEAGDLVGTRNKRSVWTVATTPYKGAHFATFPTALIEPCIMAGAPAGGVVLDPFFGSGTTGEVAQQLGRKFIGCELNSTYEPLQRDRLRQPSLNLEVA